jgi:hypothetical protein
MKVSAPRLPPRRHAPSASAINSDRMPSRRPRSATRSRSTASDADRLEDGAAGEHEVGPIRPDAGVGDARREIPGEKRATMRRHRGRIHPQPVDAPPVIPIEFEMHAGERRHGARRAEQVEAAAACDMLEPIRGRETLSSIARRDRPWRRKSPASRRARRIFGKRHHADRQRRPRDDVRGKPRRTLPRRSIQRDLRGAAADVEEDEPSRLASTSVPQPETASRASVSRSMISSSARCSSLTRAGTPGRFRRPAGLGRDQPRPVDHERWRACWRRSSAPRRRGPSRRR